MLSCDYTEVMRSYIISLHICYYYLYQLYGTVQCTTCYDTDNAQLVNKYADTAHSSECILSIRLLRLTVVLKY